MGEISYDGSEWAFTAVGKYGHDNTERLTENTKTSPQGKFAKERKKQRIAESQEEKEEPEKKKTFFEKVIDFFC